MENKCKQILVCFIDPICLSRCDGTKIQTEPKITWLLGYQFCKLRHPLWFSPTIPLKIYIFGRLVHFNVKLHFPSHYQISGTIDGPRPVNPLRCVRGLDANVFWHCWQIFPVYWQWIPNVRHLNTSAPVQPPLSLNILILKWVIWSDVFSPLYLRDSPHLSSFSLMIIPNIRGGGWKMMTNNIF